MDDQLVAGLSAARLTIDRRRGHAGFDADHVKPGTISFAFESSLRPKHLHVKNLEDR